MPEAGASPRTITRELGQWVAGARFESLPPELLNRIRTDALDSVAVGLFGHTQPWVSPAVDLWIEHGGRPDASVWGRPAKLPVPKAVMANSHAMNSFEYDDTYVWGGFGTHPGNNVTPSALAISEFLGNVSGKDFLLALAVGHEVSIRVMLGFVETRRGYNHTALTSTFGSAATAAKLLGLNGQQSTWALGSAGGYVGGLLTIPPHSMVKRMVNARAAEGGVIGALLAQRGFTGIENLLESENGGFYATVSQKFNLDKTADELGTTFYSVNVHTKRYPMVTSAHSVIEAACRLVAQERFASTEVTRIIVHTNSTAQKLTVGFAPDTFSSAQMSLTFGVAAAIRTGNVLPEALLDDGLENKETHRLLSVIEAVKDARFDEMSRGKAGSGTPGQVEVYLRDGRHLVSPVVPEATRMTDEEIEAKARVLMTRAVGAERSEDIIQFFRAIERRSVDELVTLLQARRSGKRTRRAARQAPSAKAKTRSKAARRRAK